MTSAPWVFGDPAVSAAGVTVPDVTVPDLLTEVRREHPERAALWFLGRRVRYRTVRRDVRRFAAGLAHQGIGPGDRVSVLFPPSPQQVIAVLAIQRLGAVPVLHNPVAPARRLRAQVREVSSVGAVVVDHAYGAVKRLRDSGALRFVVVSALADYLQPGRKAVQRLLGFQQSDLSDEWLSASRQPDPQSLGFMDLARSPVDPRAKAVTDAGQPAALVFAGGADVIRPVALSHRNLVAAASQMAAWLGLRPAQARSVLTVAPPFTAFGLMLTVMALRAGATQVLVPRFEAATLTTTCVDAEVDVVAAVPPVLQTLADIPHQGRPLGSARVAVTGPEPWDPAEQDRVRASLSMPVVRTVGTPQMCGAALSTAAADLDPTSLGMPLPGTRMRVIGAGGDELPTGREGRLQVTGPQVTEVGTTGDQAVWADLGIRGRIEEDGRVIRSDGLPERTVTGGLEVSVLEVRSALEGCRGVARAQVVPVAHPYRGSALRAYVVPEDGALDADEVFAALSERLEPHMLPRELLQVSQLPDA